MSQMQNSNSIPSATETDLAFAKERGILFMMVMAVATGIVAGVGAWGFRMLIGLVHNVLFLGQFTFTYDANVHTAASPWGPGIILVPVIGGIAVAWLVKNFAPEAKGHGVPEVMDAIHYNRGRIRPRVAVVKSLASAISIGSGGSVGREGPIVQIGSAFGSTLGSIVSMRYQDRVTLIAAGSGAGIAATFNAPLGGLVFAIELLLITVNARSLLLVATATAIASYISRILIGVHPSFFVPALEVPDFYLAQPYALATFFVLGCLMGLLSVAFIRGLYKMEDIFDAIPGNYYTRHMLGMLCVGVIMYLLLRNADHYYVEGVGYAAIMDILLGVLNDPWFLLLLVALKLLATALSLGSGASGGVFSPALFMGAASGAAFGLFCHWLVPGLNIGIATFAIAGMAAMIGGTTGAILTGIVMLTEMTQDETVMLPMIIACTVAYAVRKAIMNESIYTMKLLGRGHTVPEGLETAVMTTYGVADVMDGDFSVFRQERSDAPAAGKVAVQFTGTQIDYVTVQAGADTPAQPDAPRSLPFTVVGPETKLLEAVTAMWTAEAQIILVSRNPSAPGPDDITGVITPATIAQFVKTKSRLF